MRFSFDEVDELCINTIRTLSIDGVQKANSGHPGAPMGLAPVAYVLFSRFLRHSPEQPDWPNRDRFVLSCGHASMLLYSVLHLTGYAVSLEDLRQFRQWGSICPGHPEHGLTPGVEVTSGPLGQGCAHSVGMALAEAHLAEVFNRDQDTVVDHTTYVLCSDGDLMEGVSAEAASIAGHLRLAKLVWIWDDNRITIEGETDLTLSDDMPARFAAQGWHVQRVDDANDLPAVAAAIETARATTDRPSFIAVRSHIAFGSPNKQDSASSHGAPLGEEEVRTTKKVYGWPEEETFLVPAEVADRCRQVVARGRELVAEWQQRVDAWAARHPELAQQWQRRLQLQLPEGWTESLPVFATDGKGIATRAASGKALNAIAGALPELVGGSADLSPSCKTTINASGSIGPGSYGERNLHFGIREHAMGSMLNGMALHGGIRPFGSTFLVFADYMRPPVRLAGLMKQPVILVFTHDSVWVGEDGPTHQPVEQLQSLRLIPDLVVLRPADANETSAAWQAAVERTDGPTALILSRQGLPVLDAAKTRQLSQGAYVLEEADGGSPELILVATGSEVHLALEARTVLASRGVAARVVSMPSWELFDRTDAATRARVLPSEVPTLAIEAGVTRAWSYWLGSKGAAIGIDRYGESAPGKQVAEKLGLAIEKVVERALNLLGRQ